MPDSDIVFQQLIGHYLVKDKVTTSTPSSIIKLVNRPKGKGRFWLVLAFITRCLKSSHLYKDDYIDQIDSVLNIT